MPDMDFLSDPLEIVLLNLSAIMHFPSKRESRKRRDWSVKQLIHLAADQYQDLLPKSKGREELLSEHIGAWLGGSISPLGGWTALANATIGPGQKKSPVAEARDRFSQGAIAGWVLKSIFVEGGGIKTAAERFASDGMDRAFKDRGLSSPVQNSSSIRTRIWPKFKDAAHLWAAYLLNEKVVPDKKRSVLALEQFEPGGLPQFLAFAEEIRVFGEGHIPPHGSRKPILDAGTVWKVPDDFDLADLTTE